MGMEKHVLWEKVMGMEGEGMGVRRCLYPRVFGSVYFLSCTDMIYMASCVGVLYILLVFGTIGSGAVVLIKRFV